MSGPIAVTALGNTEPAVNQAMKLLREAGFQVIAFHASGAGGSAMEELIEEGIIHGVLDLTPHELTEEVVGAGAYLPVKPGRLRTAGRKRDSPGGLHGRNGVSLFWTQGVHSPEIKEEKDLHAQPL